MATAALELLTARTHAHTGYLVGSASFAVRPASASQHMKGKRTEKGTRRGRDASVEGRNGERRTPCPPSA